MNFDIIALAALILVWALLGTASWLAVGLQRRGQGMLVLWPLAAAGGIAGGALVPAVGLRDVVALLLSIVVAMLGGLLLTLLQLHFFAFRNRRSGEPPGVA